MTLENILEFQLLTYKNFDVTVYEVGQVLLILAITRTITFLIRTALNRAVLRRRIERGSAYALGQIIMYVVWTLAVLFTLDFVGVQITVILASSTALFVGLGLGLQDTFKDFISGIVLLSDRSVAAGDIVEVDGIVGKVHEVGLRTTKIKTRDDISVILPNSRLTTQGVINWAHQATTSRFHVEVGVAYGSDTRRVEKVLLECGLANTNVLKDPEPSVQFRDFGSSALVFRLYFYSTQLFLIELVKSDLRFAIDEAFRKHGITIAFAQMDVWIKEAPKS
ncbi:MAG: hypothetical protein RIR61_9 [Bacteroidota bacterium]|jgi:small-conductance mechanosensitive channel